MGRYATLLAFVILAFACSASSALDEPDRHGAGFATDRPNIVVVVTDDMRTDDLRFTPQTRQLIGESEASRSFERAFVATSLCCPSRATMLTGRYMHNHEVWNNVPPEGGYAKFRARGLEDESVSVALDNAGYETALAGKWLNYYDDPAHVPPGWDRWFARLGGGNFSDGETPYAVPSEAGGHVDDATADKAVGFVRDTAPENPLFLWVGTLGPKGDPAPRDAGYYTDASVPRIGSYNEADVGDKPQAIRKLDLLNDAEKAALDQKYRERAQSLRSVDDAVARLVDALRETGRLDNTYFFFTSDHGVTLGEHRLDLGKSLAYEEHIHVPLLVRGPTVAPGTDSRLVVNTDLAPTIADLAGVRMPTVAELDGRSIKPLLAAQDPPWRSAFLVEKRGSPDQAEGRWAYRGIRTKTRLYVEHGSGEKELYELETDPHELDNLAGQKPDLEARLSARLDNLKMCSGLSCRAAED